MFWIILLVLILKNKKYIILIYFSIKNSLKINYNHRDNKFKSFSSQGNHL
jgi:hypothetical protein